MGASGRPLNFTVRSHFGKSNVAKNLEQTGFAQRGAMRAVVDSVRLAGVFDQRIHVRVRLAAALLDVGARARSGLGRQQPRLWRCAPGADRLRSQRWARLTCETMSPSLAAVGPHAHSGDLQGDF